VSALGPGLFGLVLAAGAGAAHPPVGVHLSWVRDDAAADCPDAGAIEAEVTARLGDDPFRRAPSQFIEATVTRPGDSYQVAIAMRGPDGKLIGSRSLASTSGDCRSIATAAALTVAILIDPDALLRPIAPAPAAPPPPPAAPPPPARGIEGRVSALGAGARDLLPGTALGVELGVTIDVGRWAAVGVIGALFPEHRTAAPDDGFAFGLTTVEGLGCFVPIRAGPAALRWELCAGLAAGLLSSVVYDATPVAPGQRWTFAAAQLTRLIIPISPISRSALVEAGVEITEPFPRRAFFVEGRPPGMDTVFTQPTLAVKGFAGVGLRWR
jgi:hypothetical protein